MAEEIGGASAALRQAFDLMGQGDIDGGELIVLRPVVEAEQRSGVGSAHYLDAVNDLGQYLLLAGDPVRAVETLRRAVDGPPSKDPRAVRGRILALTNLGDALRAIGENEEAEPILRDALQQRRAVFGTDRPDYAAGLDPLADLLLAEGRVKEALPLAEEACLIYAAHTHPRFFAAIARRAEILARVGFAAPLFPPLPDLPEAMGVLLVQAVQERTEDEDPSLARRIARDLLPLIAERVGPESDALLLALAFSAETERRFGEEGDAPKRQGLLRRMAEIYAIRQEPGQVLMALQGLALAESEAGDHAAARTTYGEALRRAEAMGDAAEWSRVLRNFGLYQAELKNDPETERLLREAIRVAGDTEPEGRARASVALAIFLRRHARPAEAIPLLRDALTLLDPDDHDARLAQRALTSLLEG